MGRENKFELISVAYRSRFLFRTEGEYREALGVSYETVVNNRRSVREMDIYFGVLAKVAAKVEELPLATVLNRYVAASEFYLSLDWGDRTQLASRRKFCRMLFRLYATAGKRLSNEESFKFKIKNDDDRLMKAFFPDGPDEAPAVDIEMVTLFAFGVLRPFTDNSRGRDIRDKETLKAIDNMRTLLRVLESDMPRLGSTEKPMVFNELLCILDDDSEDMARLRNCTPLWLYSSLRQAAQVCRSLIISVRDRVESFLALHLYGIWVDDADGGERRFWIFPDNCQMAFCYEYDGMAWRLRPSEFKVKLSDDGGVPESFLFIATEGSLRYALSFECAIPPELVAVGGIEIGIDEDSGELCRLEFLDGSRPLPEWFRWRRWERLSHEDPRYGRLREFLRDIYAPGSVAGMLFENVAPELIDRFNNLVGRDNRYLYVYDWQAERCVVRERGEDLFQYEVTKGGEFPMKALWELEVSEKHPLYAIPLDIPAGNYGSAELNRFVEIMKEGDRIGEVYVVHSDRLREPRLAFPEYAGMVGLDMEILGKMGIRKFTESPFH